MAFALNKETMTGPIGQCVSLNAPVVVVRI
jgi:hypothetical protein